MRDMKTTLIEMFTQHVMEIEGREASVAVEAVARGGGEYGDPPAVGRILSFDEAKEFLSNKFNDGFGSIGCHYSVMWTAARVYYTHEYDGAVTIHSVPRHPTHDIGGW